MLLNEVQKQHRQREAQEKLSQSQQEHLKALEEEIQRLEATLHSRGT